MGTTAKLSHQSRLVTQSAESAKGALKGFVITNYSFHFFLASLLSFKPLLWELTLGRVFELVHKMIAYPSTAWQGLKPDYHVSDSLYLLTSALSSELSFFTRSATREALTLATMMSPISVFTSSKTPSRFIP